MSRQFVVRGAALVALSLFSATAFADESPAAPARAGLKVHMDPATGTVVDEPPATAAAKVQETQRVERREKADYNRMSTRTNAHGAVLLNLNGQVRMYSVARVTSDGKVEESCITGNELAKRQADGTLVDGAHEHSQDH